MKTLLFVSALLFTACTSEIMDDDYSNVDPNLQKYVDEFVSESSKRGISIDPGSLKLHFGKCPKGVAGETTYSTSTIIIDTTHFNISTSLEEIVFHEFGHLYLHRDHNNETIIDLKTGKEVSKSLMTTKSSIKYINTPSRKSYYLDEMFNEKTKTPEWAN